MTSPFGGYCFYGGSQAVLHGGSLDIYNSFEYRESVCVTAWARNTFYFIAYVANRNCLELVRSLAPPQVTIDALLEVSDSEWHSKPPNMHHIPAAQELLAAIAMMDIQIIGEKE